jgi:hypothetical protein
MEIGEAQTAAIDFFTVPTATFRVLFVFVVLSHERRGPCSRCGKHFSGTRFYGNQGSSCGAAIPLAKSVCGMTGGLHPTGVPGPRHRVESEIVASNTAELFLPTNCGSRTLLSLGRDAPEPRAVEPPKQGRVAAIPQGGSTPPIPETRRLAGASRLPRRLPS